MSLKYKILNSRYKRYKKGENNIGSNHKKDNRPPYGIIAILMIGAFISFLNNTLLNIALPSIMKDLAIGPATVQWLATGFMLVSGILIPTTAFLIQKFSVRQLFLAAMAIFTIGTLLAGIAHTFPILLAGRMLQAAGSAILMPLLMNVMLVSFPIENRSCHGSFRTDPNVCSGYRTNFIRLDC